jgi:hypothetical protein
VSTSFVHEFPSLAHVVRQFPSHVSPASTTPLPHTAMQFGSLIMLQPLGQQESPATQAVIAGCVHWTLHMPTVPVSTSFVHEFPSFAQVVGQLPSHVSPGSTTPLPQIGMQFGSVFALQLAAQHESPARHCAIAV